MKNILYLLVLTLLVSCASDIEKLEKKGYSFTNDGFYKAFDDYIKDSTDLETVKLFLENDKDSAFVNYMKNKFGETFFTIPIIKPHPELVDYLFSKKYLDSSFIFNDTGENLLHFAFGFYSLSPEDSISYYNVMKLLLNRGCDPNNRNIKGLTLLVNAISKQNTNLVSLFLQNGADPNLIAEIDNLKVSPLMAAIVFQNNDIINMLLDNNANAVDFVDKKGYTSLAMYLDGFSTKDIDYDILDKFIKQGVNIDKKNKYARNPLFSAVKNNDIKLVKYLLKNGANPNMKYRKDGKTASILQLAAIFSNYEIVNALLEAGADKSYYNSKAYDEDGYLKNYTAYELARSSKKYKIAKLLKTKQTINYVKNKNRISLTGKGMFSAKIVDKGFIDSEISKYTVVIKRTSDLNGSYVYDEKRKITHTSGFFGDDCIWYDIPFGYYKVRYYGYNKNEKKIFDITFKDILHKGNTIGEFPTDTEWNTPYIRHE